MRYMIRISSSYFVAGADMWWDKEQRKWICTYAAPIIKWLTNMTYDSIAFYAKKKGWTIEWLEY